MPKDEKKTKEEELKETPADEKKESPGEQEKEDREGSEAVKVPEEFQKKVYDVVYDATKEECAYMRDCIYQREDILRRAEDKKDKGKKPSTFSAAEMPT